jgi:hypothetical protein
MRTSPGFHPRKLIAPLIIVGVAIALGLWGSRTGGARNEIVERYVRTLCTAIANGEDAQMLLGRTQPAVAQSVRRQIAIVCDAHSDHIDFIDIDIVAGDISPHPGSETATHSVLIGDGTTPMLGLRIACKDDANSIRILGWWNPQAR